MLEEIPFELPELGREPDQVFSQVSNLIKTHSADIGAAWIMAHMDPPTPEIAAKVVGLNAEYNQNLLHPDLSPLATVVEKRVIDWLLPYFGMTDGHFCAGSTIANLTAIWCARKHGAKTVVASKDAHISVAKAADILGMKLDTVAVDSAGKLNRDKLTNLKEACLVLTAGTTGRGAVDDLSPSGALWTHVDAAWAAPLRLTKYSDILDGIEKADSVAISAHKWFYQPKDSALVLFKDKKALRHISYGGSYLAAPNVGVQGSRGAAAIPLMATLMAWGRSGLAQRIEKSMADAEKLADFLRTHDATELKQKPETAVVTWRPKRKEIKGVLAALADTSSQTQIDDEVWVRQVAANPFIEVDLIILKIKGYVESA
ncbi:pyridoxal phosphate-dependent decarboxylase family protein [Kordiimonas aquimaris]|uniref:pyridoxal phosphate-dependent decarboxylase family protein n=1 Tax=Kordiimonas aquimaris TaxID=707591 RepID=UPI0021D3A627|nr:pyridoxal-dependent decarboxylase [Kordiimonas aquimaris]